MTPRLLAIAVVLPLALLAGCATITTPPQQRFLASDFSQYSADHLKVAVLLFANETRAEGAEVSVRRLVIDALLERAGEERAGFSLLDVEITDERLAEADIDTFQAAMDKPLTEYGSLLNADAVLVGQVSEYLDPTGMARLEGVAGARGGASPSVRAYLQLYDCRTGKLLWQAMPQGSVVPILAIGSAFTSMEKARQLFKQNLAQSWPLQTRDKRGD